MATMVLDTYNAVQGLKKAGLVEEQAAAIVALVRWASTGEYTSYAKYFRKGDDAGACDDVEGE